MNMFNVPKKINRHVLKAVNVLSEGNLKKSIPMALILNQVHYQMRNLVPVPNLERVVQKSLNNLSDMGLIKKAGSHRFAIGRSYAPPTPASLSPTSPPRTQPSKPNRAIFKPNASRKRSTSYLDPNLPTPSQRLQSEDDSLSGSDEFERTRKRLRTNNKNLRYLGSEVELPKAKKHQQEGRLRGFFLMENFEAPAFSGGYLSYTGGDLDNLGMLPEWSPNDGGQPLLSARNSNMEFMLSNLTPLRSLEIVEIPAVQQQQQLEINQQEEILENPADCNSEQQQLLEEKLQKEAVNENPPEKIKTIFLDETESSDEAIVNVKDSTAADDEKKLNSETAEASNSATNTLETLLAPRSKSYLN